MNRRDLLKALVAGGVVATVAGCSGIQTSGTAQAASTFGNGGFSFVHMTDIHVRRKRKGDEGYRACVASIKGLPADVRPEFALMGGDLAFDGLYTPKEDFIEALDLYKSISDTMEIPYYSSIGNHDVLGWSARRKVSVDDPDLGKKLVMEKLGMEKSYYSFNHKGWHFVVLDSIHPIETNDGPSYEPRIGEEQLDWLAKDLGKHSGMPTVAMTHVAAFCNVGQINADAEAVAMNPGMVLRDTRDLRYILERHKVRMLLQGHSHANEDYTYRGVRYFTSNAVSACWWGGTWKGFKQGYTLFHCKEDQLVADQRSYPWVHHFEPADDVERKRQAEWDAFEKKQAELLAAEKA